MAKVYTREELNSLDKDTLITVFLSLQDQLQDLNKSMNRLIEQVAAANNQRFGRSSEKMNTIDGQLSFDFAEFNEAEALVADNKASAEPDFEEVVIRRRRTPGKRAEDLKGLPVKVVTHELSDSQLQDIFGEHWKNLPDEVYRRLHYEPARFTVIEHHIRVYAGRDNQTIVRADRPKELLPNSLVSPSLEAGIMNEKFVKAVPYYRFEQELKRNGINISRQAMAGWTIKCAERYLSMLYEYLHESLYRYHVLQADETPVLVTKDGRSAGIKSYMWVYRTGKMYKDKPIVLYEYQKERKADHPREFLRSFHGVVVTDGYQVYHKISKELEDLNVAGCWSHARRRFMEAVKAAGKDNAKQTVAYAALQKIAEIYHLESVFDELSPEDRLRLRQQKVKPLVEAFFAWIREYDSQISRKTKTGAGFQYCLNQEQYLRYFLEDGEVPIDNNAAEQAIRGFCIGKKNWVMIDTIAGAKASAIIYSIAETAKANNLNPFRYFEHLLTELPLHMDDKESSFLEKLLPWSEDLPENCRQQLN